MLRIKSSIYLTGQVKFKSQYPMTKTARSFRLGNELSQNSGHAMITLADYSIGILNLGHWDLFVICDLLFEI